MSQLVQQKNAITLQDFATLQGLTKDQVLYLAKRGRIMGAQKAYNGLWLIFPPAKLSEPIRPRKTRQDRGQS